MNLNIYRLILALSLNSLGIAFFIFNSRFIFNIELPFLHIQFALYRVGLFLDLFICVCGRSVK